MKTKKCAMCFQVFPETTEFFYYNKTFRYFRDKCKECTKKISRDHYHKMNPPVPREWDEPVVLGGVDCPGMYDEVKKCFVTGCRYHMTPKEALNKNRITAVYNSKFTCLFEIIDNYPNGLSLERIGSIMGVTMEAIRQTEAKALDKLKKRAAHLETYNEDDVDLRYIKPERVLGTGKLSEKTLTPVWSKNFEHSVPVGEQ